MIEYFEGTEKDVPELAKLYKVSEEYHRARSLGMLQRPSESEVVEYLLKQIKNESCTIILAKASGQIVAYVQFLIVQNPASSVFLNPGKTQAVINELVVSDKFRRQGLGKKLMLEAEQRIQEKGIKIFQLNVFNFNEPAKALYESLDYVPTITRMYKVLE